MAERTQAVALVRALVAGQPRAPQTARAWLAAYDRRHPGPSPSRPATIVWTLRRYARWVDG